MVIHMLHLLTMYLVTIMYRTTKQKWQLFIFTGDTYLSNCVNVVTDLTVRLLNHIAHRESHDFRNVRANFACTPGFLLLQ